MHWRRQLLGTGARASPLDFQLFIIFSGHFTAAQTLDIRPHVVACPVTNIQAYCFVIVHCMNFTIFLYVTLKLISLSVVPLLAPNPGDATDAVDTDRLHR